MHKLLFNGKLFQLECEFFLSLISWLECYNETSVVKIVFIWSVHQIPILSQIINPCYYITVIASSIQNCKKTFFH